MSFGGFVGADLDCLTYWSSREDLEADLVHVCSSPSDVDQLPSGEVGHDCAGHLDPG